MSPRVLVMLAIALAAGGQMIMKRGLNQITVGNLNATNLVSFLHATVINPVIISGFVLYGVSSVLWLFALSKVELSLAYPMLAGSYVVVAVLSYFLFGEHLSATRMAGLAIIAVGVVVLARS